MSKPNLIILRGTSGSGKDTIAGIIEDHYDIMRIPSYTDRDIREGEKNGREHLYLSEQEYSEKHLEALIEEDVFASTQANNGKRYMTLFSQIKDYSLVIFDDKGVEDAWKHKDRLNIYTVSIRGCHIKDKSRLERDKDFFYLEPNKFDFHIDNTGSKEQLLPKIKDIIEYITLDNYVMNKERK